MGMVLGASSVLLRLSVAAMARLVLLMLLREVLLRLCGWLLLGLLLREVDLLGLSWRRLTGFMLLRQEYALSR